MDEDSGIISTDTFSCEYAVNAESEEIQNIVQTEELECKDGSQITDTVVMVTTNDLGQQIIVIPSKNLTTKDNQIISIPIPNTSKGDDFEPATVLDSDSVAPGEVITLPTDVNADQYVTGNTGENNLGQIISIPTESLNRFHCQKEKKHLDDPLVNLISEVGTDIQENDSSPLSFVALVTDNNPHIWNTDTENENSQSFVALVPDSTHHAPPISTQEDENNLTLKEITARERSRLIKRAQRQNTAFRERERIKSRTNMKDRRKDPVYREQERKRDRERRKLARHTNNELREKERIRDREYRRRIKIQTMPDNPSGETECTSDSLEYFMKDMDEKCQLLINCKEEGSHEDINYSYNVNEDFDDEILGSSVIDQNERTDLIRQYEDSVLQSEIISVKDTYSRQIMTKAEFESCTSEIT